MAVLTPGKCRVCGCTDARPCLIGDAQTCSWFDKDHTLCDNLDCIAVTPMSEIQQMEPACPSLPPE
jgi:hypothetical protein